MRHAILLAALLLATPADAQEPRQAPPSDSDVLGKQVQADWTAMQVSQEHIATTVRSLLAKLKAAEDEIAKLKSAAKEPPKPVEH